MIPVDGQTQQDLEMKDADRVNTHTQMHENIACKPYMHSDALPFIKAQWYALLMMRFLWLIAMCELAYWTQMHTQVCSSGLI